MSFGNDDIRKAALRCALSDAVSDGPTGRMVRNRCHIGRASLPYGPEYAPLIQPFFYIP